MSEWPESGPADLAIVGGGASGLAAAIAAARCLEEAAGRRPMARIVILEKNEKVGRKLLATGNGRCNLTNSGASPESYHGKEPRFCRGALRRYPVEATLDFFRSLGLVCRTEEDGRIYPACQQAAAVLDVLRQEVSRLQVKVETRAAVTDLVYIANDLAAAGTSGRKRPWHLRLEDGRILDASAVVLAAGGQASPALGSDGSGYRLAAALGHRLVKPVPALVQVQTKGRLTLPLSGIRVECVLSLLAGKQELRRETGEVLFTDYGLSGIPILQISRLISEAQIGNSQPDLEISLDLLPEFPRDEIEDLIMQRQRHNPGLALGDLLTGLLHQKVGRQLVLNTLHEDLREAAGTLAAGQIQVLADAIKDFRLKVGNTRDFSQAQVTAGGLDCRDFAPDTLESRLWPGLFAAGELLDVDGDCGGYNLQWAWSSGLLAGTSAGRKLAKAFL
jgi:predicted Rossmann fold flavoprotein